MKKPAERYCSACEGAPAYPEQYEGEDGMYWAWMCCSSGCYVGDSERVLTSDDIAPALDTDEEEIGPSAASQDLGTVPDDD